MTETPARDWLRPRVEALMLEAAAAGFPGDVVTAVLTDLLDGEFNTAPVPTEVADDRDPGQPAPPPDNPDSDALAADADLPIGLGAAVPIRHPHAFGRGGRL